MTLNINNVISDQVTDKDQEIKIDISISELPSGDSYLRIGMKNGSTYVGYIKNNSNEWVQLDTLSNDKSLVTCNKYFKVNTDGVYTLSFKIGYENEISNGSQLLKIHRFTESCKTVYDVGDTTVNINLPTPTPSPTPTPTQTPTASPTNTPTSTPSPTPKPTPTKSTTPKSSPSSSPTSEPTNFISDTDVKIIENTPIGLVAGATDTKKSPVVAIIFIISGIVFLGYGAFLLYNMKHVVR